MKKSIIIIVALISCSVYTLAQSEFEALKFSKTDLNGTARYMSMAGAFGALGGDASAIKDNPAGLGIYRKSEVSGTMNMNMGKNETNWNGVSSRFTEPYKTTFDNFAIVFASSLNNERSSGLLNSNWSFSYNRLKNFNRSINIKSGSSASSITNYMAYFTNKISSSDLTYTSNYEPFNNQQVPFISVLAYEGKLMNEVLDNRNNTLSWNSILSSNETVTPSFNITEQGHIDEYSIGWAGNFNNQVYLGVNLNFRNLDYTSITQYSENLGNNRSMALCDSIYSNGKGVNLSLGLIYRSDNNFRYGLSIQTPTIYSLDENYYSKLNYKITAPGYIGAPRGTNSYQLQTPFKVNASVAYIYGKKAILSAEYVYLNYTATKLIHEDDNSSAYTDENNGMKTVASEGGTIKLGGEYKLTNELSLRAGFAHEFALNQSNAQKYMPYNTIRTDTYYFLHNSTNYLTAGIGYREANWFIDCAYVFKRVDEDFRPYRSSDLAVQGNKASVITKNNNLLFTLGLRF